MSVVLMYHGLYRDELDLKRIDIEDRPYAISATVFEAQLIALQRYRCGLVENFVPAEAGLSKIGAGTEPDIVITFDDGHASNYDIALPLLRKFGLSAYFFVTTDFIGHREHFCTWEQLCDMQSAGMVIGSHGKTHGFFADMGESEAIHEFSHSMKMINRELKEPVFSISFPGGRYLIGNLEQASGLGYTQIFGSGFGTLQATEKRQLQAMNRIPIRYSTSSEQFNRIIDCDRRYYTVEHSKQLAKSALKKTLGNDRYHALYKFAADRR